MTIIHEDSLSTRTDPLEKRKYKMDAAHLKLRVSLFILVYLSLIIFCGKFSLMAQTSSSAEEDMGLVSVPPRAVGIGLSLYTVPEDKAFESEGTAVGIFYDMGLSGKFLKLRFGFNRAKAQLNFSQYGLQWKHSLQTDNLYGAFRYATEDHKTLRVFFVAGLSLMSSELSINHGVGSDSHIGVGIVGGGGGLYRVGSLDIGLQFMVFSGQAEFKKIPIATGSNQLQLVFSYPF